MASFCVFAQTQKQGFEMIPIKIMFIWKAKPCSYEVFQERERGCYCDPTF